VKGGCFTTGKEHAMTLFKRGRIYWTGFYVEGQRYQYSTGVTNRRIAETIEQKLRTEAQLQRFNIAIADPHVTFSEIAKEFEEKAKTSIFHRGRLVFLNAFFGEMPVIRITKNTVAEYRVARQKANPKLKDSTLNRDIAVIRRILYWAQEQGRIAQNPLARVGMVRERRTKKPIITIEHEQKLLEVAKPHLRDMIVAALDTGLRRGELFKQQWEDIDLANGVLYVTRSKTAEGEAREIPLTKRLKTLLAEKAEKAKKTAELTTLSGPVFTFQGRQVSGLKRSWQTAQRDAKLPVRYRFHDLRHAFATRLMLAGVIQDVRMALMGHEPRTVHWGYTHVELVAKREAIRKLEQRVLPRRKINLSD